MSAASILWRNSVCIRVIPIDDIGMGVSRRRIRIGGSWAAAMTTGFSASGVPIEDIQQAGDPAGQLLEQREFPIWSVCWGASPMYSSPQLTTC